MKAGNCRHPAAVLLPCQNGVLVGQEASGLLSGLIRQHYTITTGTDSLHQAIKVQKLLRSGDIDIDDVISKLINAYGCNNQEKILQNS